MLTDAFIGLGNSYVYPSDSTGGYRDNAIDLGYSTSRFKDLYLSGGVVFGATGGTVTSKTLDDYEEGTWTPAYGGTTSNPTVTHDVQEGHYTKVGRLVTVYFTIGTDAASGGSGNLKVTGLPFTVAQASTFHRCTSWAFTGSNTTYNSDRPDIAYVLNNSTYIQFWDAGTSYILTSMLATGANSNRIYTTLSYMTDD